MASQSHAQRSQGTTITDEFDSKAAERARRKAAPLSVPDFSNPAPEAPNAPLFKLRSIHLSGLKTLSAEEVSATYSGYIGRMVSQADLAKISAAITRLYSERGYGLSRAFVPPQDIQDGHLEIKVVEGYVADVSIDGIGPEWHIARDILAGVKGERPTRLATLERHMLLVADLPGLRIIDAKLNEMGPGSGRFRLMISAEFRLALAYVDIDNRGSNATGPWQNFSTAILASVAAPGDALIFNFSTIPNRPHELVYVGAVYDRPIGTTGMRAGVRAAYSEGWPGGYQGTFDTRSRTQHYSTYVSIAPLRTREASVRLTAAAGFRNSDEGDVTGPNYSDRVRSASLTADLQFVDKLRGSTYASVTARQGVAWLGASERGDMISSRPDAPADFSKLSFVVSRYQALSGPWSLLLAAAGHISSSPLLRSESFFFGGVQFGRAFAPAAVYGDSGLAGLAELRFDQQLDADLLRGYQLYGFVDRGAVWTRGDEFQGLSSFGGGVRLFVTNDFKTTFEVAVPMETAPGLEHGARFYVSLSRAFTHCDAQWCK